MGGIVIGMIRDVRLGIFLNAGMGAAFIIAAVIIVLSVNYSMRQQALIEAQSKARIILDRNLATHTYFSHILKPGIFAWSEPFRTNDYFDPAWMSSTYAIREIEKYFKSINPSGYSFKDAAINARSPENEADAYERAFLEKLNADKKLESESAIRTIDGKPYLVVLRKGEVMEESCLRCHSHPKEAPKGLIDYYGAKRSFHRKVGDPASAVSLRIPLAEAYEAANIFSLKLSAVLLVVIAGLFAIQLWFHRRFLLKPLDVLQEKAIQIATNDDHLGEEISQPFGRELIELAAAFNEMSRKLRHDRDGLEKLVDERTEILLREKGFAESLIQTAQVIVLVLDKTGCIVSFNPFMEEVSGYTLEEVKGKDWFSTFLPERSQNRTRELFLKAIHDIQTRNGVDIIMTKDGRERLIEWNDKTLKDEAGNTLGLLAVGQDVTERKQMEEVLRNSESKYRFVTEKMSDVAFILDMNFRTTYVSPSIGMMLGFTPEERMQQTVQEQLTPESLKTVFETLANEMEKERAGGEDPNRFLITELEFYHKDGSIRNLEVLVSGIRDDQGHLTGFHGLGRDVTERRRLEAELLRARRMEAIGRLASGAAHEIRNPLNIMSLHLQMLDVTGKMLDEEVSKAVVICHEQVSRITRILSGLDDFSRIPEIRKAPNDLKKIVEDVLSVQGERLRGAGVIVRIDQAEDFPPLMLDKEKIAIVITHLVSNAVDAMEGREKKRLGVSIQKAPGGRSIRIAVSDTGHGIKEEDRGRIFDPFFTTREAGKGTGLGLSVSYGIIRDHNGTIQAESNREGGTTFIIELPA